VAVRAGALRGARVIPPTPGAVEPADNDVGTAREPRGTCIAVKVGIPSEVKNHEYRVAITPSGVFELKRQGHEVFVQKGAGAGSSITDDEYVGAGATILDTADDVWGTGELILKVKEPIAEEYPRMRKGQTLFTYLHLAASRPCTDALLESGVTAIAYETVELPDHSLPLLAPMSEVAGRLAPQVGAQVMLRSEGGRGVLMGGVSGVYAAKVVVIGAGVSGMNAAAIALGMQAEVILLDRNIERLRQMDRIYQGHVQTVASNSYEIERAVLDADLVIGAVLVPGAKAPKLVSNELVSRMKPGSVLVDIAIDQGGCFEDSRPTTHTDPTYRVHDSMFYCVANMPGAVPHTSTYALTNVTLPYALELANKGWRQALRDDRALGLGLNTHEGAITYGAVGEAFALPTVALADVLA
jgi:alanine dehydrogenase